jgi:hypothetical protein
VTTDPATEDAASREQPTAVVVWPKPEDLGVRITYLASEPITDRSFPDCYFAVPFA